MKSINVCDNTISLAFSTLSFKEKIETIRLLDALKVNVIDMPEIQNEATDLLLIRTISAFIKNSCLSVETGLTEKGVKNALTAISNAKNSRLKISIPVSTVQMEYFCHKKPAKLLDLASQIITMATSSCNNVELCALDATRADLKFFKELVKLAVNSNVNVITLCDDEGTMLPDDFVEFIKNVKEEIPELCKVKLGVSCKNTNNMAMANMLMAIKAGVDEVKTCIGFDTYTQTNMLQNILNSISNKLKVETTLNKLELHRLTSQIEWILNLYKSNKNAKNTLATQVKVDNEIFDKNDSKETIATAVKNLGYDLTEEDNLKVYEEFLRVTASKSVGNKELDAIVASVALQVVPTYVLKSYVINNGNKIASSAQIILEKKGEEISGICIGDGPVDASFKALEQIIGTHYELDDFQIQSITEGREAMGSALVKLRYNGKLYSGKGISTDIIGSSIRAYINAVNKIVYEEE